MNKKAIILAVLLLAAGGLVAKAILFPPLPEGYQMPAENPQPSPAAAGNAQGEAAAPQPGAPAQPAAGAPTAAPGAANVNVDELIKNVQVVEFQYDPTVLSRNPMSPLVGPQAMLAAATTASGDAGTEPANTEILAQQMAVTGIIWDKRFPVAVINNDVVAPGDVLADGIVVKSIESDKVILAVRDQAVTLPLKHLEEQ